MLLCITTMVGVTLVARPPFIFDTAAPKADEIVDDKRDYYIGVAMSVLCGASGSLMYVLAARCRKCPKSLLMVSSGLWTLLIAFLCPAMGITNRVFTGTVGNQGSDIWSTGLSKENSPYRRADLISDYYYYYFIISTLQGLN